MRTITRAGLAVGAAFVLALAPAGEALAASGNFQYHGTNGEDLVIEAPENGECYLLVSGADWAFNATDAVAHVYEDHGCEGPSAMLWPGMAVGFPEPVPHSVRFG